jgi:hypothetical protein
MIIECIKEGFSLTHRNWQLILLRAAVALINLFLLLLFMGIPLLIIFISVGIDMAQARDLLPELLSSPEEIIPQYLGTIVLLLVSFTVYLLVVSVITLYVFGGTIGILRKAALDVQFKFSMTTFFQEAKNLFFPLLWLFSFVILIVTAMLIIFGIMAGIAFAVVHLYGESGSTLSVFVVSFFTLLLIFFGIVGGLGSVIFTAYAVIALVVERKGTIDSLKNTWSFIKNKPISLLFYIILVVGITGINILLMIIGGTIRLMPIAGLFINIPYQLVYYAVQVYLGIVLWSSLLIFYTKGINYPVYKATYDI